MLVNTKINRGNYFEGFFLKRGVLSRRRLYLPRLEFFSGDWHNRLSQLVICWKIAIWLHQARVLYVAQLILGGTPY
jgi:uncharacterized membrane protein YbhN (UPF0104 family)